MTTYVLPDAAGRRRSPAALPGYHRGRPPRNKGRTYPADPPTVEEIVSVMRCAGETPYGLRGCALIVLMWRAGLRISEALALAESDLDRATGGVLVRHGKGGKRRQVGMSRWGWQQIEPWLDRRIALPVGALLCVKSGSCRCQAEAAVLVAGEPDATDAGVAHVRAHVPGIQLVDIDVLDYLRDWRKRVTVHRDSLHQAHGVVGVERGHAAPEAGADSGVGPCVRAPANPIAVQVVSEPGHTA